MEYLDEETYTSELSLFSQQLKNQNQISKNVYQHPYFDLEVQIAREQERPSDPQTPQFLSPNFAKKSL